MNLQEIINEVLRIQAENRGSNDGLLNERLDPSIWIDSTEIVGPREIWNHPDHSMLPGKKIFIGIDAPNPQTNTRLEGEYREKGIDDVLAWYTPFHFSPDQWGITIRAAGIELIAEELVAKGMPFEWAYQAAFEFLLHHEYGHFETELLVSGVEISANTPLYTEGKMLQRKKNPPWGIAEEGLCNSMGRRTLPKDYKNVLDEFLSASPKGYRDFKKYSPLSSKSWGEVLDDICRPIVPAWVSIPHAKQLRQYVPVAIQLDGSGPLGSVSGAFLGPIFVVETPEFFSDIEASGNRKILLEAWQKTVAKLAAGAIANVHLEKILDNIYTVRLNKGWRAAIRRPLQGKWEAWEALMVDQQHDRLYERIKRRFK